MTGASPAEKYARFKRDQRFPVLQGFEALYSFPLDGFQQEACRAIEAGHGVLVAAPTGSGKTIVGEFAIHLALEQGRKAFYTTPIKALSNQKYNDLVARYGGDRVGLLTGDNVVNGEAPVVVMTTEVLRNMLYAGSSTLTNLGYVVMDEVHYLADRSRGAVWEEVIIHLPESVTVVSLSATVSNAEEFGEWLSTVRGETLTIVEEKRPVPLFQHVMVGRQLHDLFADDQGETTAGFVQEGAAVNPHLIKLARDEWASSRMKDRRSPRQQGRGGGGRQGQRKDIGNGRRIWIPSRVDVVHALERAKLLPAIVFIFSRAACDAAVHQCLQAGISLTTPQERDLIRELVEAKTADLPAAERQVVGYFEFLDGLTRGLAAHHAGMLPVFKEVVEDLYLRGLTKVVFATETLALGINMPARTVVIEKLGKWNGEAHVDLSPGEYTQLVGRAGRRGLDVEGHGVVLWQPGMDPKAIAGLASTRTYPLRSSFRPSYNMAVNLVHRYGRGRSRELLSQSFAQFQADRSAVGLTRQLRKAEDALNGYAEAASCHLGDFLEYARLRDSINQLEKDTARERKQGAKPDHALIDQLRRELKRHPCHACPEREDHARWGQRYAKLHRDTEQLRRRVENRTHSVARQFDRVCEVLDSLGYLAGDTVTEAGARLMRLYSELDLVVAEELRTGAWEALSAPDLAAVLSTLVFEARRADSAGARLPSSAVRTAVTHLLATWNELSELEHEHDLEFLRQPETGLAALAHRWAAGDDLDDVLGDADMSAGDFVRWMKLLVDLCGQVADATTDPGLRATARGLIDQLKRGVVAYTSLVE